MGSTLRTDGNLLERVTVTLTRRDIALMNLCLGVVVRDHTRGGSLRSDIESLQTRLALYQSAPKTSQKKQAGWGDDCGCQGKEHIQQSA